MPVNLPADCSGKWIAFGCFSKSKASNPPIIRLKGHCASESYGENVPKVQKVIKATDGLRESSPSNKHVAFNQNPRSQSLSTPFNPTSITSPQISLGLLNSKNNLMPRDQLPMAPLISVQTENFLQRKIRKDAAIFTDGFSIYRPLSQRFDLSQIVVENGQRATDIFPHVHRAIARLKTWIDRGRKGNNPSPPSEPGMRFSRTRLSSRWFPHRDWRART